jgi:hypothetical protein
MGITKKMKENKCRQGYGEKGTLSHCWWESKLVQQLWEPLVSLLKKSDMVFLVFNPIYLGGRDQEVQNSRPSLAKISEPPSQ